MGTFTQKLNQPQRQTSSNLRRAGKSTSAPAQEIHSAMHWQRTPGHQPVQCVKRANDDGLDSGATATAPFAHDFSRMLVNAKAPAAIQTKLMVNIPGDTYEQEADRVAE